jgi:hypothetical protein
VAFPFVPAFLLVLLTYMGYSEWARLDSRYLIVGALGLLLVTAVVDAAGATDRANTLAEFVFLLLAGGVVLLLVDHLRDRPPAPPGRGWFSGLRTGKPDPSDAPQEQQRPADQSLDGPE